MVHVILRFIFVMVALGVFNACGSTNDTPAGMSSLAQQSSMAVFALTPPPPKTANLWVGASGSCARSSVPSGYSASTSCSSFQAAQNAASGGDVVLILDGTYGGQTLSSGAKSSVVSYFAQT